MLYYLEGTLGAREGCPPHPALLPLPDPLGQKLGVGHQLLAGGPGQGEGGGGGAVYISPAPGGAAEPQGQVVKGGGQLPSVRGVGQGRAAGKQCCSICSNIQKPND